MQQTISLPDIPVHGANVFPQSFAQQRLWFMDQMEPGHAYYNAAVTITLQGLLDVDALRRTLAEIVRRHEALRTVFAAVDGTPVQIVRPPAGVELPLADLSSLDAEARAAEAERLAREEAAGPFDLARGPLFRPRLLRLAEDEHVLILCLHHIVGDGWSLGVIFGELCELYGAFSRGEPSPLPELEAQYADFAVWQREQLEGDALRAQLEWWTRALAGAPAPVTLPADRARPPRPSYKGAVHVFRLPRGLDDQLRALSRAESATLFMTLLAGWQALLHRCTGQDDLVVGTPIANRTEAELEPLIGFFVNMLALRADLGDDPSFRTLLGRVRQTTLGAFAHQDLPFEKLVEELAPERSLDRQPLFGVVFALQTAPWPPLQMPGLRLRMDPIDPGTARYDLTFTLREDADGIGGRMEYAADLFDEVSVRRLARHYVRLLEAVASDPDARVGTLPLADVEEVRAAVELWNATARPYPRDASIPALFAEQVRNAPESVAVVHGDERVTYAQLDARAERLARRLRAAGAGPGTRVGVCTMRGIGMAAAWLAVLRTGAAYMPLPPTLPPERLAWMLADAEARLVVADAESADAVANEGITILFADGADAADRDRPLSADVGAEDAAYVVYTSGSTGRPKGTEVTHRGIVRLVCGADYAQLGPDDRVAQLANPGFDTAAWEVWGALLNGGTLVFHPLQSPTVEEMAAMLRAAGITSLWLTSGLFHQVVDEQPEALGGLRRLLAGGDVLSPPHVARVVERFPHLRLINGYGPTENSTFTTCHPIRPEDLARPSIPVGRPIANSTAYVLDPAMRPVPAGVPGELYAGGDGVALGYLRRPRLTAERFVPDPFATEPGARLYRTGDRVRWTEVRECEGA
ncbi:MAG TPA: amino acid adenylation domain-containing protein, partial [Longimicrobium sp.]|nr:amino acid adenylation domain-containing protein [Longimicrobium sp.]